MTITPHGYVSILLSITWFGLDVFSAGGPPGEAEPAAIALYAGHDANIALAINGRVQCVLELERWFEVRYFHGGEARNFSMPWLSALRAFKTHCECEKRVCPSYLQYGLMALAYRGSGKQERLLPHIVSRFYTIDQWVEVDHHEAHALLGYYTSPFSAALIVSYDAGGNDGTFRVYFAEGYEMVNVASHYNNFGELYNFMAFLLPEVTGKDNKELCETFEKFQESRNTTENETGMTSVGDMWLKRSWSSQYEVLSYAGKLMGYAAIGSVSSELGPHVGQLMASAHFGEVPEEVVQASCGPVEQQRSLGATFQNIFQYFVKNLFFSVMYEYGAIEGLVITGGCALNVLVNYAISEQLIADGHAHGTTPLGIHVPVAPNDGGLSVGALWKVLPPPLSVAPSLQYLGFRLWDEHILDEEARQRGAQRLSSLGGVDYLAELLVGGPAWLDAGSRTTEKPIIAVVRGRQEFGPRALGHRSLVAIPDSNSMRDRMNRLKFRQWYRPVAPMIADEALEQTFGRSVKSPYMSMAPPIRDEVKASFPALAHLDGTARHQSVGKDDEAFIHALLLAVGNRTGLAALINTSFNTRGKPIVNKVADCLTMLDDLVDLDFVLIEDWLFKSPPSKLKALRAQQLELDLSAARQKAQHIQR